MIAYNSESQSDKIFSKKIIFVLNLSWLMFVYRLRTLSRMIETETDLKQIVLDRFMYDVYVFLGFLGGQVLKCNFGFFLL